MRPALLPAELPALVLPHTLTAPGRRSPARLFCAPGNRVASRPERGESPELGRRLHRLLPPRPAPSRREACQYLRLRIASAIETGEMGLLALDEADIPPGPDRDILEETVRQMEELHAEGRNHIWAYYTRNLVRPIWLSTDEGKVDAIVGNPPWITYSRAKATVREEPAKQSKEQYRIWAGGPPDITGRARFRSRGRPSGYGEGPARAGGWAGRDGRGGGGGPVRGRVCHLFPVFVSCRLCSCSSRWWGPHRDTRLSMSVGPPSFQSRR